MLNTRTTSRPVGARLLEARDVVRSVVDVLILAEPLQASLWRNSELTLAQRRVLRTLRDAPASPGELAEASGISAQSLARMLARLEQRGFIHRETNSEDRRRVEVTLAPAGHEVLDSNRIFKGSAFSRAARQMSFSERRVFVNALRGYLRRVRRELERDEASQEEPGRAAADRRHG